MLQNHVRYSLAQRTGQARRITRLIAGAGLGGVLHWDEMFEVTYYEHTRDGLIDRSRIVDRQEGLRVGARASGHTPRTNGKRRNMRPTAAHFSFFVSRTRRNLGGA